ncbi:hypothetical protein VD0004_g6062 [Verticillium dahliae]|uniref:alpha-galactosidase n=1 Tax=Verticillium dahliae TaxID=27337 RepID=A0A444S649_VERDA|nr:hypothetical protein VD0004_g6062 [Verticillium dahliae]PNH69627.1 hypothetical protein VD0001_g7123 [Verticillium dahliae]RXG48873.1 hypothetical protein VDGE_08038 [Verticillium dahliae]
MPPSADVASADVASADVASADSLHAEPKAATAKPRWPLWKKLALVGVVLVVAIALAVGLGVGLSNRNGGGDDDENNNDNGNNNGGGGGGGGGTGGGNSTSRESLWQPEAGASWQIVLIKPIEVPASGDVTPDVDAFDIDLFDNSDETFSRLREAGKKVICYFSAGSWEDWRDDKDDFGDDNLGKELDGWPGEKWVDVASDGVRNVMKKRIQLAANRGCDAIDPDNVDGFQNDNGLGLTKEDAVDFVKFLSETALQYNMSTGLKNAGSIIPDVLEDVHFSVNEQCVQFSECETFAPFIKDNKPVFHIEYPKDAPSVSSTASKRVCTPTGEAAGTDGFSTVIKKMNLDGWVEFCDGEKFNTTLDV